MGQDERDDSIQESLQHLEQKIRAMEKMLLKIDKNFQSAKNNETCISEKNNLTEEYFHLLEQKAEEIEKKMLSQFASVVLRINDSAQESYQQLADQKKNMLSRLASMNEEIILDVSTDISKLNDSVQELADQMGYRVEQVQTAIVNSQMLLHAPSNCCQIDNEIMKQEIVSEVTQKIKQQLSPLVQCLLPSNIGQYECNPAKSCREIKDCILNSPSGYYYIKLTTGPTVRAMVSLTKRCVGRS